MERLTTLAFLAGQTTTIRRVTSAMVVSHRSPIFTARALSDSGYPFPGPVDGGASGSGRLAFAGTADEIASDIHRFQ